MNKKKYRKNLTTPSIYSMNPNFPRETPQKTVNVFSPEKKATECFKTNCYTNKLHKNQQQKQVTRKDP